MKLTKLILISFIFVSNACCAEEVEQTNAVATEEIEEQCEDKVEELTEEEAAEDKVLTQIIICKNKNDYAGAVKILEEYIKDERAKTTELFHTLVFAYYMSGQNLKCVVAGEELLNILSLESFGRLDLRTNTMITGLPFRSATWAIQAYRELGMPNQAKIFEAKLKNIFLRHGFSKNSFNRMMLKTMSYKKTEKAKPVTQDKE